MKCKGSKIKRPCDNEGLLLATGSPLGVLKQNGIIFGKLRHWVCSPCQGIVSDQHQEMSKKYSLGLHIGVSFWSVPKSGAPPVLDVPYIDTSSRLSRGGYWNEAIAAEEGVSCITMQLLMVILVSLHWVESCRITVTPLYALSFWENNCQ